MDEDNKSDTGLGHSVLLEIMSILSELFFPLSILNTESVFVEIVDFYLDAIKF